MTDMQQPSTLALSDVMTKTVIVGLSYFDNQGKMLQQQQIAGEVIGASPEGIVLETHTGPFNLPAELSAWFSAPPGEFRIPDIPDPIVNPDFLVTWDIYKVKDETKPDGQHEWWEWYPRTTPPSVNPSN